MFRVRYVIEVSEAERHEKIREILEKLRDRTLPLEERNKLHFLRVLLRDVNPALGGIPIADKRELEFVKRCLDEARVSYHVRELGSLERR